MKNIGPLDFRPADAATTRPPRASIKNLFLCALLLFSGCPNGGDIQVYRLAGVIPRSDFDYPRMEKIDQVPPPFPPGSDFQIGDLPLIGPLFRSQEYRKGQTELVIFVTPRLARPMRPEMVRLPTDDFVDPNDVEFSLLGRLQGRKPGEIPATAGSLGPDKSGAEGAFGHDL